MGWREKQDKLLESYKVLVVGAGGIGCELLKDLVLTGFKSIHVIDLDTIDVSNLNRQFLFRREHVGMSKAEVATNAVRTLLENVNVTFDHGSIFEEKFGLTFFQQFNFVMNALDNRAARTHVNRMCLAGRIPLIESGSAGYLGQVTAIIREKTECFECIPKPTQQKVFPGCTIRNTPSEHIHCTVWAKHLFNQLFGEMDIDDDVSPDMNDEENKTEDQENGATDSSNGNTNGKDIPSDQMEQVEPQLGSMRSWAENENYCPEKLFNKLFNEDIKYLLKMVNLWKERRPPVPVTMKEASELGCSSRHLASSTQDVNQIWSGSQCSQVFSECISSLKARKEDLPEGQVLHWDKDDEDAMRFVAACANIRAQIFGIPAKSLFDIKSMAGNIIPAIATTNAVVAGMMVVEVMKLASGMMNSLKNVFINRNPNPRGKILMDEPPRPPNPKCFVCSERRECFVRVNLSEMTVHVLKEKILRGALSMVAPDVMEPTTSRIIISSEEGETDGLKEKTLAELSIRDGSLLDCDDFVQKLELKLIIQENSKLKGDQFEIEQDSGKPIDELASRKRKISESDELHPLKKSHLDDGVAV